MGLHRFYHADRNSTLVEGQIVELDSRGLSRFGAVYWDAIQTVPFEKMNEEEQREFQLEQLRNTPVFNGYTSRMQALFGANTIEEAKRFVDRIEPKSAAKVPIYEVYASTFFTFDMNWLDFTTDPFRRVIYLEDYWNAAISNHNPAEGERRLPSLEVLMALPVTIGKIVAWA